MAVNEKGGRKDDEGKIRWVRMISDFHDSLLEMVRVYNFGGQKHGFQNWRLVDEFKYKEAAESHLRAIIRNEDLNTEKDNNGKGHVFYHAAHLAWNALALCWFAIQRKIETGSLTTERYCIYCKNNKRETTDKPCKYYENCYKLSELPYFQSIFVE